MARRTDSALVAALGCGGACLTAFAPSLPGLRPPRSAEQRSGQGSPSALRGAAAAGEGLSGPAGGARQLGGLAAAAMGVSAVAARLRGGRPRGARAAAARRATDVAEAPAVVKEDLEPPAPPAPFDPAKQVGAMDPLGFFDPLGFTKVGDEAGFRNLRAAELKHGRVAMMASTGLLVQSFATFSVFEGVPKGIQAAVTPPGLYGFVVLVIASGALELLVWKEDPEKDPGDFGDPAGWGIFNNDPDVARRAEWVQGFRERELNNGRFAMFATIGILSAELLTGKTALAQFGL